MAKRNLCRLYILISSAILIFCIQSVIHAQEPASFIRYRSPRFIFGLAGSFNVPVGDARGDVSDFFSFKNYGLVHGIGFTFSVKFAANKNATLFPVFTAGFSHLQNDDQENSFIDSNTIANGYPLKGGALYNSTPGSSLLVIKNIHLGLGLQYMPSTKHSVIPYGGFEINYNYLWGFYEQYPRIVAGSQPSLLATFDINKTQRIGFGLDLGLNYRINEHLGFVTGARYAIANLFGKKSEATTNSADQLNSMNLLDKASTDLNSNLSKNRNLSYLQFYIGFSVFTGRK